MDHKAILSHGTQRLFNSNYLSEELNYHVENWFINDGKLFTLFNFYNGKSCEQLNVRVAYWSLLCNCIRLLPKAFFVVAKNKFVELVKFVAAEDYRPY